MNSYFIHVNFDVKAYRFSVHHILDDHILKFCHFTCNRKTTPLIVNYSYDDNNEIDFLRRFI